MVTEFKVGDKVRCKKGNGSKRNAITEGKVYTVLRVDMLFVYIIGDHNEEKGIFPNRFELVTEQDNSYYVCRNVYPHTQNGPYSLTEAEQVAEDFARGDLKDVMVVKLVNTICPTLTVTKKSH